MLGKGFIWGVCCAALLLIPRPAGAFILINEFLADPPAGIGGDANGDGIGSTTQDEFIEFFNPTNQTVNLSGWKVSDAIQTRHVFGPSLFLSPNEVLVLFAGGNPNLPGVNWQALSSGSLSLNNSGDTITLLDANDTIIDQVIYGSEGNQDQSLVRFPEGTSSSFVGHLSLPDANGKRYSPGKLLLVPPPTTPPATSAVPEPLSMYSLGTGLLMVLTRRKLMA